MSNVPRFFMQDEEGSLYGYWRTDMLKCDVASYFRQNGKYPKLTILQSGIRTIYAPLSIAQLEQLSDDSKPVYERAEGREL